MARVKLSLLFGLGASALLFAPLAFATNGIVGANGKPNVNYPNGDTCNRCHSGGTAPTVSLTGPASLTAGQTGTYTFTVGSGSGRAVDIAATDTEMGTDPDKLVVVTPGQNMEQAFDEVVHTQAAYGAGSSTFKFDVKAPATNGTVRIYAAGLASNKSNSASGDKATLTTKDVTITGGIDPDAGSNPFADSGTSTTDSGTSSGSDGGSSGGSSGGVGGGNDAGSSSGGVGGTDEGLPQSNSGGCSVTESDAPSLVACLGALGAFAALGGARRRKRR